MLLSHSGEGACLRYGSRLLLRGKRGKRGLGRGACMRAVFLSRSLLLRKPRCKKKNRSATRRVMERFLPLPLHEQQLVCGARRESGGWLGRRFRRPALGSPICRAAPVIRAGCTRYGACSSAARSAGGSSGCPADEGGMALAFRPPSLRGGPPVLASFSPAQATGRSLWQALLEGTVARLSQPTRSLRRTDPSDRWWTAL
ncbi:hypothetical protein SAMN02799630_02283 [Paenibacillus sp. UNCCL117]|nr:hypothetical protein SAMN04488602_106159 [Paenibacillus sp. cl123]SFW34645.1 hypothetical protein SAMN02799630_02283 [Paenibacillus sp. UNCCL117]